MNTLQHQTSFERIYNEHYQRLIHFASRYISDIDDIEDIVSDVFTKLWVLDKDIYKLENLKAYLYRAVHNKCIDYIKADKRLRANREELLYVHEKEEESVIYEMLRTELLQQIATEIGKLPIQYIAVCKLCFFEGLNNEEIAKQLDISIKTVRNIKGLAINKLQTVFLINKLNQ